MRNRFLSLVIACLAFQNVEAGRDTSAFEEGNRLFAEGKYPEARDAYMRQSGTGPHSANLYYNLGNALHHLQEDGRAMLNFERALILAPSHPEADSDLDYLRARSGARVIPAPWFSGWYGRLRLDWLAAPLAVGVWLVVFAVARILLCRGATGNIRLLLAGIALVAYSTPALILWRARSTFAVVTTDKAIARFAPVETAQAADTLPAGSQVRTIVPRGNWTYVTLPDERRAWLPSTDIETVRL